MDKNKEEMSCTNCKNIDECDEEFMYVQGCWCENYLRDENALKVKKYPFADDVTWYFKKF